MWGGETTLGGHPPLAMIHIKLAQGMAWRKSCGPTSNGGSIWQIVATDQLRAAN
jgi:hypothetical protein